ncbi:hypothetical protein [Thermococcus sp. JCM 11816]|uniref:hypothetical protein n=1 Tax=Thermococcus sp. (strain JCM 11816 / KS-1) TaxID=1295125 RepID=UPI0006D21C8F
MDIGRGGVSVVGNVQSNGTIIIRDNTEVFGNVVGKKVEIGSNVNILGNVIAESDITVGEGSKIGGYVSSLKGMVKLSRNVEVFDVFGGSGTVLGSGVNIVDYTVYSKGSTVVEDKVYIANYEIDAPEIIELGAGLNLLQVLPTSRYSPEAALKYLRENIRSIVDIKTYLRENNIKPDEIEVKMRTARWRALSSRR